MIEWDPHKKLIKRDDEFTDIETALSDIKNDLDQETMETT